MNSYLKSFFGQKASESIVPLRELHPTVRTAGYYHIIPLELFVSSLLGRQKAAMQTGSGHSYDKLGTSVTCHPAAQRPGAGSSLSPQLWGTPVQGARCARSPAHHGTIQDGKALQDHLLKLSPSVTH